MSLRDVHNKKDKIHNYWSEASTTSDEDKDFIRERSIELGIQEVMDSDQSTLEHIFGVILGTCLKVDSGVLDEVDSLKKVWTIGLHITKIYRKICNYKHEHGVPVHSEKNKSAKYLLNCLDVTKLNALFVRSRSYMPDIRAKRWLATALLREHIEMAIGELLDRISCLDDCEPVVFSPRMSPQNNAKRIYNNSNIVVSESVLHTFGETYERIRIHTETLKEFEINSIFNLLIRADEISKGEIYVPIIHEASTDESLGRSYNVFSRIRSTERLKLGYISYDMSAALQSISLYLIQANKEDYPMLWNYTHDEAFKHAMRTEIAQALGIEEKVVKAKLTAYANGSITGIRLHTHYKVFQAESDNLRRAVLDHVSRYAQEVLDRATEQSRRELPEELDWSDTDRLETPEEMRNTASVFFFVWTWYERLIRKAMLTVLPNGIELHDAVYSKADIPVDTVQDAIKIGTGFDIRIEKEMLSVVA